MIIDGRQVPRDTTIEVDLCVVGAGPAGISVVLPFLEQSGLRIALLETGGLEFDEAHQELAGADVVGHPYHPVKETRIRMFGGSTISWGGNVSPLAPLDFEHRSWVPHSGWPLSHAELAPYYTRAFGLLDVDLNDPKPRAHLATVDEEKEAGAMPDARWSPVYSSPPTRFGKKYVRGIADSHAVKAYLHATATQVQLNESGTRVKGLQVRCLNGHQFRVTAKHYVLAGGGIENARLLLTSNDVQQAGVGNQHDVVGRFFQEHPRVVERFGIPQNHGAQRFRGAVGALRTPRLRLSAHVQEKEHLLSYIANLAYGFAGQHSPQFEALRRIVNSVRSPWSDSPYRQHAGGGPNNLQWADLMTTMLHPARSLKGAIGAAFRPAAMQRWIEIESCLEQTPRRENRIVLTNEVDKLGIPKAELHWSLSEAEERTYHRGLELVLEVLEQYVPGISACRLTDSDPWPDKVLGTWHHMGTTRMHADPIHGVVDANCRVHGITNLYIAGSSVFPTGGASAPTLTIVALALRLADHLANLGA